LPYAVSRWALRRVNEHDGQPCIFYFHPGEIDPVPAPPEGISLKTRVRHYLNLSRTETRLRALLGDFHWDRADRVFLDRFTSEVDKPAADEASEVTLKPG
jgi:hypothetical protein